MSGAAARTRLVPQRASSRPTMAPPSDSRTLSAQAEAKSRKSRYSFEGNQRGMLPQTVTTVWRTELGTTLVNGFNSTTDASAYFHCLNSYKFATNRRIRPKFLSGMASPREPRLVNPRMVLTACSVAPQRDDRIHGGGPARRDVTRQERNSPEEQGHGGKCRRISGADTVQQAFHEAGERQGRDQLRGPFH